MMIMILQTENSCVYIKYSDWKSSGAFFSETDKKDWLRLLLIAERLLDCFERVYKCVIKTLWCSILKYKIMFNFIN